VQDKALEWLAAGTIAVLVLDPPKRTATVYRGSARVSALTFTIDRGRSPLLQRSRGRMSRRSCGVDDRRAPGLDQSLGLGR